MIADDLGRIPMSPYLVATLKRAAGYAEAQSHLEVTLEHLLLALAEDPEATVVLKSSDVDLVQLVSDVSGYLGRIEERQAPGTNGPVMISQDLRRILEAAAAAASQGRRREINGAIVLAAIVGDGKSTAANILRTQGLTFEQAIRALQKSVNTPPPRAPEPLPSPPPASEATDGILAATRERVQSRTAPPGPTAAAPQAPQPYPSTQSPSPGGEPAPPARSTEEFVESMRRQGPPPERTATVEPQWQPASLPPAGPPPAKQPQPQSYTSPPSPPQPPSPAAQAAPASGAAGMPPRWAPPQGPSQGMQPPLQSRPAAAGSTGAPRMPPFGAGAPPPMPSAFSPQPPASRGGPQSGAVPPPWSDGAAARPSQAPIAPLGSPTEPRRRQGLPQTPAMRIDSGQLGENIPRKMRVGISMVVEARVARSEVKAIAEGLQGSGAVYRHEIMVSKAMSVRLRAPDGGFWIETSSPETQWIENVLGLMADDFASWRWTVTPRERGKKRLQLVVSARTVGADGLTAETALPDQVIDVKVGINIGRTLVRWSGWLAAAVLGGLLGHFGQAFYEPAQALFSKLISG